jgi:ATP-dependent DNA helicase RecG
LIKTGTFILLYTPGWICGRGETIGYIRQAGFKPIQHEQMIINYIEKNGRIKREEVMELCMLTKDQAAKLLKRLKENNKIVQMGERKTAYYILRSE